MGFSCGPIVLGRFINLVYISELLYGRAVMPQNKNEVSYQLPMLPAIDVQIALLGLVITKS